MSPDDYDPEDINVDDRFNVIAPGQRFHPSMRKRPDPTVDPRTIKPTAKVVAEQERLRAQAAYGPGWDTVEVVSKNAAMVGGHLVTLDSETGVLSCSCPSCDPDCWHVVAVRDQALDEFSDDPNPRRSPARARLQRGPVPRTVAGSSSPAPCPT